MKQFNSLSCFIFILTFPFPVIRFHAFFPSFSFRLFLSLFHSLIVCPSFPSFIHSSLSFLFFRFFFSFFFFLGFPNLSFFSFSSYTLHPLFSFSFLPFYFHVPSSPSPVLPVCLEMKASTRCCVWEEDQSISRTRPPYLTHAYCYFMKTHLLASLFWRQKT